MVFFLVGCGKSQNDYDITSPEPLGQKDDSPLYERKTTIFPLKENANPYMIRCSEDGIYYFAMETNESDENEYQFYFQAFEVGHTMSFTWKTEGYVKDFVARPAGEEAGLAILWIGEQTSITELKNDGKLVREVHVSDVFIELESFPKLFFWHEGYLIGLSDKVYFLDEDGRTIKTMRLGGTIISFMSTSGGELYAITEKNESGKTTRLLEKLQAEKNQSEVILEITSEVYGFQPFEEGVVLLYPNRMTYLNLGKSQEKLLVDFDRQGIVASQIHAVYGNKEEIRLISTDPSDQDLKVMMFTLTPLKNADGVQGSKGKTKDGQEKFAADGRRIIHVAIPESCLFQVEFHAKKYNQENDASIVQVERFSGSLEDYLGKGNRPDVIMFTDHTELDAYVQKGVLVNLLPMFEKWDSSELEGMIPKARELLGNGSEEVMYAMAARFRLLLRVSNGEELDAEGKCDAISYFRWYDEFMSKKGAAGMGSLENVIYANLPDFYNVDGAKAYFTSKRFQELMKSYKELLEKRQGQYAISLNKVDLSEEIARGPSWRASYRSRALVVPGVSMEGLPKLEGGNRIYIKLDDPMAILSTSECQQEAFGFIAYYVSLKENLVKGWAEQDYGKLGNTMALFSVWEKYLREEIYESERCYAYYEDHMPAFYTEEQSEHLKQLIRDAVPDTKIQRDIYAMLLEEMDAYLKGGKSLESVCEIIQNRAELYLKEQ